MFSLNYSKNILCSVSTKLFIDYMLLNFIMQWLRKKRFVQDSALELPLLLILCSLPPISTLCYGYYFAKSQQKDGGVTEDKGEGAKTTLLFKEL